MRPEYPGGLKFNLYAWNGDGGGLLYNNALSMVSFSSCKASFACG